MTKKVKNTLKLELFEIKFKKEIKDGQFYKSRKNRSTTDK